MTTFALRPLTLLDLLIVGQDLPADELDQMKAFGVGGSIETCASRLWLSPGPKWAIAEDSGPAVACGGLTPIRKGVVETWFWATPAAWETGTNLSALVREVKSSTLASSDVHRIETYCLASREQAHAWYTFCIGLQFEATLHRFCSDGRDAKLFVATANPGLE